MTTHSQVVVNTDRNPVIGSPLSLVYEPTEERRTRDKRAKKESSRRHPIEAGSDGGLREHSNPDQGWLRSVELGKDFPERTDAKGMMKAPGAMPENHPAK